MKWLLLCTLLALLLLGLPQISSTEIKKNQNSYKEKLSDYGFFEGPLSAMEPTTLLTEYWMNTPLFSDYAHKKRFIVLPEGQQMRIKPDQTLDFPQGTMILKTFYYPADFRKPEGQRRLLETRILYLEATGWTTLNYLWNEEQTEAYLDFALHLIPAKWLDLQGKAREVDYQVPNVSLCKVCHLKGKEVVPIGPVVNQLNRNLENGNNQLQEWFDKGLLAELPQKPEDLPKMVQWDDPKAKLELRARAWLDANCAHCHTKTGSAAMSGLHLNYTETNPLALGIRKKPMTRSLMNEQYTHDIEPGKPEASILVYRIESHEPNVRMPKIACQLVHQEGLELIKEWIRQMK